MKKEYDFSNAKRGPVISQSGKTRITIYIDTPIIDEFRRIADEAGHGYQTMINDALKQYLDASRKPLDADAVRQVIREELERASSKAA